MRINVEDFNGKTIDHVALVLVGEDPVGVKGLRFYFTDGTEVQLEADETRYGAELFQNMGDGDEPVTPR